MSYQPSQQPPQIDIVQTIRGLERAHLEDMQPIPSIPYGQWLQGGSFWRVSGLAEFWEADPAARFEQQMEDLLAGLYGQGQAVFFFLVGLPEGIELYLGAETGSALSDALRGAFPGITLAEQAGGQLAALHGPRQLFANAGRLTGIPSPKATQPSQEQGGPPTDRQPASLPAYRFERLIRALRGQTWGYLVGAKPLPGDRLAQEAEKGFGKIADASALVKAQFTAQTQKTPTMTETVSWERLDRRAQYCVELLERQFARLTQGKAQGMWQANVVYFAADRPTLDKMGALLRSLFAGPDSLPDPVRAFACTPGAPARPDDPFQTQLTSAELALLMQPLREEFPGYRIAPYTRFDVDISFLQGRVQSGPALSIGAVLDGGQPTGAHFAIPRDDFARHGLVAGVTGSGKTNTIFYLLDALWNGGQPHVPWLVIEPAKTEYRHLRAASIPDLQVFTLGDERYAPFRLNPFEFEIGDAEHRIHVQTHIDFLKSVFNAAFILYAPMPYVLETCLHQIYQDKGWDLTSGQNRRLPPGQGQGGSQPEEQYPVFPTLSDLYNKIDQVVRALKYEERIEMDVQAGLKARIGSLLLGGKGLMLDAKHSLPLRDLLSRPTALELEGIGNDDEKAFIIGLIMTRIYEYRRVQAMMYDSLPKLQHMLVIEEAHRLLKNVPTEVESEGANQRGQAVETFANMLSEIRAYGQGVLIAEQIPVKLAPDAIKNTNLKIMHRIVAEDDRQTLGATMNMDEPQMRYAITLAPGQAAVYAEGADRPYLVKVQEHIAKGAQSRRIKPRQIAVAMQQVTQSPLYDPVPGYSRYLRGQQGFDPQVRDLALEALNRPEFVTVFNCYFLSTIIEPAWAVQGYALLLQFIKEAAQPRPQETQAVAVAALLHALDALFEARGQGYRWLYNVTDTLHSQATEILVEVAQKFSADAQAQAQLAAGLAAKLQSFVYAYRDRCKLPGNAPGPYPGCIYCQTRCLYRFDLLPLVYDKVLERSLVSAIRKAPDDDAMWQSLTRTCGDAAKRLVKANAPDAVGEAAICYAAQVGPSLELGAESQRKMVRNAKKVLTGNA